MHSKIFDPRVLGAAVVALGFSSPLSATTLKEVLENAWSNQVQAARAEQYDAQLSASQSWIPEPPTLSVSGRSDQIDANSGLREWEAEISQPIWLWGQRDRAQAVAQSEREALQNAVARLPEDMRVLLSLRYGDNMSYEALADALRLNPGTVKSRLNRAKEKLRTLLPGFDPGGE